ncbi:MAG: bifunctional chorismate mutase/prephenate dehydratase [Erysipelotrichaceae bacterium]
MDQLKAAREKINEVDAQMAKLFVERMQAVKEVIDYKKEHNLEILDTSREQEVIRNNLKLIDDEELKDYYEAYLKELMMLSKQYQRTLVDDIVVAYQGVKGAFSHIAATSLFHNNKCVAIESFDEVFQKVDQGECTYGVIPFENSYTGEIGEVLDLLLKYDVHINRMYDLKIEQNLLGTIDSKLEDIKQVYSKDQAIYQSKQFLNGRGFELIAYPNTALAAKFVSEQKDKHKAAIASIETAKLYGLKVLAQHINTSNENTTRFIVISKEKITSGTSFNLLFTLHHNVGTLAKIMEMIAEKGFNMESIKSRSLHNKPWEYYFYVELAGDALSSKSSELFECLKANCEMFKLLGSYTKEGND